MEDDFSRIEDEYAGTLEEGIAWTGLVTPPQNNPTHTIPRRKHKVWVVFRGRNPGIYYY